MYELEDLKWMEEEIQRHQKIYEEEKNKSLEKDSEQNLQIISRLIYKLALAEMTIIQTQREKELKTASVNLEAFALSKDSLLFAINVQKKDPSTLQSDYLGMSEKINSIEDALITANTVDLKTDKFEELLESIPINKEEKEALKEVQEKEKKLQQEFEEIKKKYSEEAFEWFLEDILIPKLDDLKKKEELESNAEFQNLVIETKTKLTNIGKTNLLAGAKQKEALSTLDNFLEDNRWSKVKNKWELQKDLKTTMERHSLGYKSKEVKEKKDSYHKKLQNIVKKAFEKIVSEMVNQLNITFNPLHEKH